MISFKKILLLIISVSCVLLIFGCANKENDDIENYIPDVSGISQVEKDLGKLTVIFTGDVAGALEKQQTKVPVSAVTGLKKSIEENGEDVILLDTGGSLWGTDFAQADSGKSVVKLLNKMGYTAMVAASEDFNIDIEKLSYFSSPGDMPIMSSNCIMKSTNTPLSDGGILIEKAGAKIGVLALSPIETQNEVDPLNIVGAVFEKDEAIIQAMVDNLKENGADCIIALTSLKKEHELNPKIIADKIKGIDVIIGRGEVNPSASSTVFGDTVVVYSDSTMKSIGMIELDLNEKTSGVKSFTYDSKNLLSLCDNEIEIFKENLLEEQKSFMNETICQIETDGEYSYEENGEVPFGTFVANSMRPITGAQAALLRWSTIKAFPEDGNISKQDIYDIIDPQAVVVTKNLNGAQILSCLETSFEKIPEYNPNYLICSGITLKVNEQDKKGERIQNVVINGENLLLDKQYMIAMDSSLLSFDSVYPILIETAEKNSFGPLNESVYRYIKSLSKDGKLMLKKRSAISFFEENDEEKKISDNSEKEQLKEEKPKQEPLKKAPEKKIKTYDVQSGDNLIKISKKLYGTSAFWKEILELNSDIIKNANEIKVGMKLKLPK